MAAPGQSRPPAKKIIRCLEETFESDGLYYSGHDAATDSS
jgi:hypothetical protein